MTYSQRAVELIRSFEGCRLEAYRDLGGVWTIGWGHTGPEVCEGQTITQEVAEELLLERLGLLAGALNHFLARPVTQNQFDALLSFAYNLGLGALQRSTLLRELNAGDAKAAAAEFPKWNHCNGIKLAGLYRRRVAERELFETA
jgi:lysozyme